MSEASEGETPPLPTAPTAAPDLANAEVQRAWAAFLSDPRIIGAVAESIPMFIRQLPGKQRTAMGARIVSHITILFLVAGIAFLTYKLAQDKVLGSDASAFVFGGLFTTAIATVRDLVPSN